jgi:UDP-N-acetylmuramate dehydrogenase
MPFSDAFADILKAQEPLAPYTFLRLGGPAQYLAQPRSLDELALLVKRCREEKLPFRLMGGGSNILVRDEGVSGVVIRLRDGAFATVEVKGNRVKAGAGASLSGLISETARSSLAGLESLLGIPGTVGGALRCNASSKSGSIGQHLKQVETLDENGRIQARPAEEIDLSEGVLLSAEFELESDDPESILKRMRKFWILRKAHEPLSFQACARVFKEPRGVSLDQVVEQAGLKGARVGGAELSDRHANYVIAHPGASARDVIRLIEMIRSRVYEHGGTMLQLDLDVW